MRQKQIAGYILPKETVAWFCTEAVDANEADKSGGNRWACTGTKSGQSYSSTYTNPRDYHLTEDDVTLKTIGRY
jgi:hypothetical protein